MVFDKNCCGMWSETGLHLPNHMLCVRIFAQFSNIEDASSCEAADL